MRLLLPVDGSEVSTRAVEHLLRHCGELREKPEVHLLNVQPPLHGDVTSFVSREQVEQFHLEQGHAALAVARERLAAAGVDHEYHVMVGDPGPVIAHFVRERHIDQVIMGTHGRGSLAGLLMGSVVAKTLHLSPVPVLLVK